MGRAQARAFFDKYKDVGFDKVYTSALKRTRESVQDFIAGGIPPEPLSGLNEISWGSKEGQRITPEEDAYYHWMLKEWQRGNTSERITGGESPNDVVLRQRPALDYIMSKDDEKTILVCMHGRAMRILLCELLNYPLKSMDMFEHHNLCLYQLDFTGSMYAIKKHNDKTHLDVLREVEKTQLV